MEKRGPLPKCLESIQVQGYGLSILLFVGCIVMIILNRPSFKDACAFIGVGLVIIAACVYKAYSIKRDWESGKIQVGMGICSGVKNLPVFKSYQIEFLNEKNGKITAKKFEVAGRVGKYRKQGMTAPTIGLSYYYYYIEGEPDKLLACTEVIQVDE